MSVSDQNIVIQEPGNEGYSTTITPEQQRNLGILAAHLLTLPNDYPDFEMRLFVNEIGRGMGCDLAYRADCGTAACAVGHGPLAGIAPRADESWSSYSNRAFIPETLDDDGDEHQFQGEPWHWCFGSEWTDVDNTAHGAAYRILWMLEHRAIPENAFEQREGEVEISYWPEIVEPALA